MIKRSWFLWFC